MSQQDSITIRRPDDWHLHLRDGDALEAVVADTAQVFGRGIIMPNLTPPVTTAELAHNYKVRILDALEKRGCGTGSFKALMTIYLTNETSPEEIRLCSQSDHVVAAKLYPANATTNSAAGVTDVENLYQVFSMMEEVGMVLCIHGEALVSEAYGDPTRLDANGLPRVGQLRREAVFIKETLFWLVDDFPNLRIVLEHITTREAVDFVLRAPDNVAATITAHHLLETLDAVFESHHNKCMPILKEEDHRQALLDAATGGNPKFFAGTDSAPHPKSAKETACGCAGCYTAVSAVPLYVTAFEERNALHQLEGFLSLYGAQFYGLPPHEDTITIERNEWTIPESIPYGKDEELVPFWAGKKLNWSVRS